MNERDTKPIIVNGELNLGDKPKKKKNDTSNVVLPTKHFTIGDALLSLLGILLVIYGISTFFGGDKKEEVEEPKVMEEEQEKEAMTTTDAINYVSLSQSELTNIYSKEDLEAMKVGLEVNNLSNNAKLSLASRISTRVNVDGKVMIEEEEMDASMKKIFGDDITYIKSAFSYGDNVYTYNQETKRYYLLDDSIKVKNDYRQYHFVESIPNNDFLTIRHYIAYSDEFHSWTLNDKSLNVLINNTNIKDNYQDFSYYEYEFRFIDNNYYLIKISLKGE